jgi:hypothetical protein
LAAVHGHVIAGVWPYAGRGWRAMVGRYVFESPGDVHRLMADPGESPTLFWIADALIELDASGGTIDHAEVFMGVKQAAAHFTAAGSARDHVRRCIR